MEGIKVSDSPIRLTWEIISVCNLNCPYCYQRKYSYWGFISKINDINITLKNLKNAGVDFDIVLIGGEPTLHPKLKYTLEKLISYDNIKNIELYTNGTKDITKYVPLSDKMHVMFSYHPGLLKDSDAFVNNVLNTQKFGIDSRVYMMLEQDESLRDIAVATFNKLNGNVSVDANYLFDTHTGEIFKDINILDGVIEPSKAMSATRRKGQRCMAINIDILSQGTLVCSCHMFNELNLYKDQTGTMLRDLIIHEKSIKRICHEELCPM